MFTLTFNTDTDAFQDGNMEQEIKRILDVVRTRVHRGDIEGKCQDVNGNTVGDWVLE